MSGRRPRSGADSSTSARERLAAAQADAHRARLRRRVLFAVIGVVVLALVSVGLVLWRARDAGPRPSVHSDGYAEVSITEGRPIVLGTSGAPARIEIHTAFNCSDCAQMHLKLGETLRDLQDEGKTSISYIPVRGEGEFSDDAVNAFACAAVRGYGQSFYDALIADPDIEATQQQLAALGARVAGRQDVTFERCVRARTYGDFTRALDSVATTTVPAVLIDGRELDWQVATPAQVYALFE